MRFLFYDRVTELERGKRIVGVKTFALSEEFLRGHFDRRPVVPGTVLIEAMAQLLGWLVIASHDFRLAAILSLVDDVTIADPLLRPGIAATITAELLSTSASDSLGRARMEVDGTPVASVERVIYTHLPPADSERLKDIFCYCSGLDRTTLTGDGVAT